MQQNSITLGLTGDVMIGRLVNEYLATVTPSYIWGDVLPLLKSTDINLINLEAALTLCETPVPKVFNFKANSHYVQTLTEGSIHLANLANNHVLDYTEQGLLDTLQALDQASILHVGAGKNLTEARAPAILSKNGITIGVLGCTDNEPGWCAANAKAGIHYVKVGDVEAIKRDILQLRANVDLVVLSMHWGPNMRETPAKSFIQFAHQLIELGVDIFHGHSAHIFQGIEIYKGKLILYDTGDFIDDYYVDPELRNDRSFFFRVEINKKGPYALHLTPVIISNFQVNQSHGKEAQATKKRMAELSAAWNTAFEQIDGDLFVAWN